MWGIVAALLGCPAERAAVVEEVIAEAPAPAVLYAGCEAVEAGPVCHVRVDATLRLWVPVHRETRLVLEVDGAAQAVEWIAAEDGLRTEVVAKGERLLVRAEGASWRWALGFKKVEEVPAELRAIDERSQAGAQAEAMAELEALLPGLSGAARAEAVKLRADLLFRGGDVERALQAYEQAFPAARAAGLAGRANEVALTACYLAAVVQQDQSLATTWLERQRSLAAELPEARLYSAFYEGLVTERSGDVRQAIRLHERHARTARSLGLDTDLAGALVELGTLRGRLGDVVRAEAAFAEVLALGDRIAGDARARALHSAAFVALEARARGQATADPEPRFEAALAYFSAGPYADAAAAAEARINLAYAAVLRGDAARARAALTGFEPPTRASGRWRVYLEGRVALLRGEHARALREFKELTRLAAAASDRVLEWSAAIGEGEALEGLGRTTAAIEAYGRAAATHATELAMVAADAGRERFAAERDRGAQRLVRLLLREGQTEEALCAARMARMQAFTGLLFEAGLPEFLQAFRDRRSWVAAEVERSWDLPRIAGEARRAELRAEQRETEVALEQMIAEHGSEATSCADQRAPAAGELMLVYFPIEGGVAAFAVDAAGVRGLVLADAGDAAVGRGAGKSGTRGDAAGGEGVRGDAAVGRGAGNSGARGDAAGVRGDAALAERLLGPFAEQVGRARQVRVIASGVLSAAAFHAMPWAGERLLDRAPVVYALDVPVRAARAGPLVRAVQLAPPSNLVEAPGELAAAAQVMMAANVSLKVLRGDEDGVMAAVTGADLLHYVGHARGDGWEAALELGGDRRYGVLDMLVSQAPRIAVLGGCETGLLDPGAHAGGMSLAHALLLGGSEAVIATDAKVEDAAAARVGPAVIAGIVAGQSPAEALRAVQRAQENAEALHFRVFVP